MMTTVDLHIFAVRVAQVMHRASIRSWSVDELGFGREAKRLALSLSLLSLHTFTLLFVQDRDSFASSFFISILIQITNS